MNPRATDSTEPMDAPRPAPRRFPTVVEHMIFWPLVILGTVADLWSKAAVHDWLEKLPGNEYMIVEGYVRFGIHLNDGAAFSIARGQTAALLSVSVIALIIVMGIFILGRITHKVMIVALGLFGAGIIGNLYDRAFNEGFVRDFIDVLIPVINYRWPAFNIADSLLCTAVGLMIIYSFTSPSSQKPAHRPE